MWSQRQEGKQTKVTKGQLQRWSEIETRRMEMVPNMEKARINYQRREGSAHKQIREMQDFGHRVLQYSATQSARSTPWELTGSMEFQAFRVLQNRNLHV